MISIQVTWPLPDSTGFVGTRFPGIIFAEALREQASSYHLQQSVVQ